MSRMLASRMAYEPERTKAAASIAASYAGTGIIGQVFTHPIRILILQNGTNAGISFSLDGVNTLVTLQAGVNTVLDICAARTADPNGLTAPIGWGFYAQYEVGAPTTGSIYMSAIYGGGAESLG